MFTGSLAIASLRPPLEPHGTLSPRPGGIFSTPLAFGTQSGIPTKRPAPAVKRSGQAPTMPLAKRAPARSAALRTRDPP